MIQNSYFELFIFKFRFSGRFSKPTKTSNKDLSQIKTVFIGLVGKVTTSYARDSRFIQTLLWSLELVIQINLKYDISSTSPHSTL